MADAMEDFSTQRVTMKQREVMVVFMQDNSALATGRFTTSDGAKHRARLTKEFSYKLNAVADGATKTPDKWMKCWQDWKSDVKKKAGKIRRHLQGTGGGPACRLQLTPLEEQVIQVMGVVAVCGQETIGPLDALNELQQERQENPVEIIDPKPVASGSSVVLHSFQLHEVMDLDIDVVNPLAGTTAPALTIPLPKPSPVTSESTDISTDADSGSQRKRRKSDCSSISRSTEAMDNLRNTTESLNRKTALKESLYQLELKKFEMELAREQRQARKEQQELELAKQSTEASVEAASAMKAMAVAVTAAMQTHVPMLLAE